MEKTQKISDKTAKEKDLVHFMIKIFCNAKHKMSQCKNNDLCDECEALYIYAAEQIDKCKFMESKTFCSACPVHCYKKDMREKIREVMIFSGKRMLFYHPILAIKHIFITLKTKLAKKCKSH